MTHGYGYFHSTPFPYAAMSIANITRKSIDAVKDVVEKHIEQIHGKVDELSEEAKQDIENLIDKEVAKDPSLSLNDKVVQEFKKYYLN